MIGEWVGLLLATYYGQHVARLGAGPFGLFDVVRERVFGVRIVGDDPVIERPGTLADLITCPVCTSFWVGLLVVALRKYAPVAVTVLALAGGASLLERVHERWLH